MPATYQIKDQTTPHYLTFQVVCWIVVFARKAPPQQQAIAYNSYDKAVSISEGNKQLQITYGHHRQRIKQQYTEGNNTIGKVWAGACEYITENGRQKTLTYLSGPEGVFALHIKNPNGTENIRYIHKDHLSSWHTITDENGNLLQELSFDAWGNRRNPTTWRAFTGTPPAPLFDRGFTGHEHLYTFGLINMNGRMYDPLVSRMLSPDNFIQAPDFSQSFNRYSYVWNNPLVYTDPSGEFVVEAMMIGFFVGAVVIGYSGGTPEQIMLGALVGAAAGGVGAYTGGLAAAKFGTVGFIPGAASGSVGGFTSGFISGSGNAWIEGASFEEGLNAGLVSGGYGALSGAAIGGISGGVKAHRQGNNFFTGKTRPVVYKYRTYHSSAEINRGCFPMTMDKLDPNRDASDYQELVNSFLRDKGIEPRSIYNTEVNEFFKYANIDAEPIGFYNSLVNNPPPSGSAVFTWAPQDVGFGESGHAMPVAKLKVWPLRGNETFPRFRVYINNHGNPFVYGNFNIKKGLYFWGVFF